MKKTHLWMVLAAVLSGACNAQVEIDRLEGSLDTLKSYRYDNTQGVDLVWVEKQVGMASADRTLRGRVEAKLFDALTNAQTHDAKQFLCRQLRTVGTAQSVPLLESMLTDPETSHMARYALGRISAPQSAQALHRALGKTVGEIRAGVINTLAQIDYLPAASDIAELVNHMDTAVSVAAIKATGRLGGTGTVKMLQELRRTASEEAVVEIDAALFASAQRYLDKGADRSALAIYEAYYKGPYPDHLRVAGLKGVAQVRGKNAGLFLVPAIRGSNAALRKHAIAMMALLPDKKTTDTLVTLGRTAPADAQELIVRALATREDVAVVDAIMDMTKSEHENVRMAAFEALGNVGTPKAITCLAQAAASASGREAQTARASLIRLNGAGVDQAFIEAVNSEAETSRIEIIRAMGQRSDHNAFDALYRVAEADPTRRVRTEAIASMGRLGNGADLTRLVQLIVTPHDPADRRTAEQAIAAIFNRMDDREAQTDPVVDALPAAPNDAKPSLLKLLSRPATTRALKTVQSAVTSQDRKISDQAIRTLGEWPNPAPLDTLYKIASTSANQIHRILSLRGYIRLAALTADPTICHVKALELAKRPDEIRLILAGLHYGGTLKALELAESYMNNPALKAEACMAAAKVANVYGWQDRARAKATLDRVTSEAPNDSIRRQARDVLRRMDRFQSTLAVWKGAGPFVVKGVHDGGAVFRTTFEPETDFEAPNIAWRMIVPALDNNGRLDLERTYGRIDYCCAYLRTIVMSPKAQQARLKWGVDDYITGWLNGQPVNQGLINLRQGANSFVVKVGDHGGGWNFQCELLQPDESPLEGLTFKR